MLEVENLHILHQSNEILHIFVELFIYQYIIHKSYKSNIKHKIYKQFNDVQDVQCSGSTSVYSSISYSQLISLAKVTI